jgi:NitT/TauT family transport system permease protein
MLPKRIYQFGIIYLAALGGLQAIKLVFALSDYVIPSPADLWQTAQAVFNRYLGDVLDTLAVAIVGHLLAIVLPRGWPSSAG